MRNGLLIFFVIGAIFLSSCTRDPVKIQKEADFFDKINDIVKVLEPTLPNSWDKPAKITKEYVIWNLRLGCLKESYKRSTGCVANDISAGNASPLWNAESVVIFSYTEEKSPNNKKIIIGRGKAWIVNIETKAVTGYYESDPYKMIWKDPKLIPLSGEERDLFREFRRWLRSL